MWVKRSEFDRLKERIDLLERRDTEPRMWRDDIDSPLSFSGPWGFVPDTRCHTVPITTVVRAICDHLGLKINRVPATAEKIVLEKPNKATPQHSYDLGGFMGGGKPSPKKKK